MTPYYPTDDVANGVFGVLDPARGLTEQVNSDVFTSDVTGNGTFAINPNGFGTGKPAFDFTPGTGAARIKSVSFGARFNGKTKFALWFGMRSRNNVLKYLFSNDNPASPLAAGMWLLVQAEHSPDEIEIGARSSLSGAIGVRRALGYTLTPTPGGGGVVVGAQFDSTQPGGGGWMTNNGVSAASQSDINPGNGGGGTLLGFTLSIGARVDLSLPFDGLISSCVWADGAVTQGSSLDLRITNWLIGQCDALGGPL